MSGAGDTATGRASLDSIQPPESPAFEGNKTNLIVNYLPPTLSDEAFINLFSAIGPITNHKVVRDPSSGGCLGYGFVEYGSEVDAKIAIFKLNGLKLLSKTLKVAYARPKSAKTKNCTLYITALPPFTTNESLKEMFAPYGTVINSKVLLNNATKLCNGAGFVLYATTDECESAVQALNGTKPQGSMNAITVKYAHSNVNKKNVMSQGGGSMGFMPGNNPSFAGPMRGGRNQMGRMNPTARPEPGIMCDPTLAQRTPLGVVIYIRGFSQEADDEELYSLFSPFGTVRKVSVMRDADGSSRGYGFVTMADDQEAVRAVLKLNRSKYKERVIEVRFKEAKGQGMQGDVPMMNQNMMGQNNMMMNPNMMGQNNMMMNQNMMGQNNMMNPNMMMGQNNMMGQNMNQNMMNQNMMNQNMMNQNMMNQNMMNQNTMNQNMMDDNMGSNQGMMGNQGGMMMGNQGSMMGNQGGMMGGQQDMGVSRPNSDPFTADEANLPPPVSRGAQGMRRKPFADTVVYEYDRDYY